MTATPALPEREQCVVRDLLILRAAESPDTDFLLFDSGETWTFAAALSRVRQYAAGLEALGVRHGEYVLSWQGNGPMAVTTFLALNYLGAVYVPINTAYRGRLLEHVLENAGARLMIADGRLVDRLGAIVQPDAAPREPGRRGALEGVVVLGDERPAVAGIEWLDESILTAAGAAPAETEAAPVVSASALADRDIAPTDTHMVIYTSGTTGPSKGVLCSYAHSYTAATGFRNIGPGDRSLAQLPMFHVGGPYAVLWALIHTGSAVVVDSFSVSRFWETVRACQITTVGLLGSMVAFLMKQPPQPDDRDHPLRSVIIAPFDDNAIAFGQRFDVPTFTEFNMTELSVPLWAGPNPTLPGTCGQPQRGTELKIVDENDTEVPVGASGELLVRDNRPWTISHGYLNNPEATAATWRDGWFHTGDLFRRDAGNNYFFVDRLKDALRRRGENISSFEVESEILTHPAIREASVVPVPGVGPEDEVLAVIALTPGARLEPAELIDYLKDRLAYFMIPRFIRQLDELPKTPTQKVEKHRLRSEGVTPETWDREQAGIVIERDRLTAR